MPKHTFIPDVIFFYNPTQPVTLANSFTVDTEVGLGKGWEMGYDFQPTAATAGVFNIKKQLKTRKPTQWAFGMTGIAPANLGGTTPYFITTTKAKSGKTRVHLGAQYNPNTVEPQALIGFDHSLSKKVSLWGDYSSGRNGTTSLGLCFTTTKHSSIVASFLHNNTGGWGIWTDWVGCVKW